MALVEAYLGEIRLFAGNFTPRGWARCDGQLWRIDQNTALFALLGTMYGGDGRTTFALPDLRGRVPVHRDRSRYGPGELLDGAIVAKGADVKLPSTLTLTYMICVQGAFPDRD